MTSTHYTSKHIKTDLFFFLCLSLPPQQYGKLHIFPFEQNNEAPYIRRKAVLPGVHDINDSVCTECEKVRRAICSLISHSFRTLSCLSFPMFPRLNQQNISFLSKSVKAHISPNTLSRFTTNVKLFMSSGQNGLGAVDADKSL